MTRWPYFYTQGADATQIPRVQRHLHLVGDYPRLIQTLICALSETSDPHYDMIINNQNNMLTTTCKINGDNTNLYDCKMSRPNR